MAAEILYAQLVSGEVCAFFKMAGLNQNGGTSWRQPTR